jgi:hypothetical protein
MSFCWTSLDTNNNNLLLPSVHNKNALKSSIRNEKKNKKDAEKKHAEFLTTLTFKHFSASSSSSKILYKGIWTT